MPADTAVWWPSARVFSGHHEELIAMVMIKNPRHTGRGSRMAGEFTIATVRNRSPSHLPAG
ncbi:hypothetical protein BZL30_5178 [Mycobacterium kansasii]|uniref:Uncharacterized protein n=1 Tax=Mycobacterium kansasii TaxID=1768 RepID=A0A1V3X5B5_MYCKA|nr:hypothetical protein BZL30_5178 [Mycobacterium kansasii]